MMTMMRRKRWKQRERARGRGSVRERDCGRKNETMQESREREGEKEIDIRGSQWISMDFSGLQWNIHDSRYVAVLVVSSS